MNRWRIGVTRVGKFLQWVLLEFQDLADHPDVGHQLRSNCCHRFWCHPTAPAPMSMWHVVFLVVLGIVEFGVSVFCNGDLISESRRKPAMLGSGMWRFEIVAIGGNWIFNTACKVFVTSFTGIEITGFKVDKMHLGVIISRKFERKIEILKFSSKLLAVNFQKTVHSDALMVSWH